MSIAYPAGIDDFVRRKRLHTISGSPSFSISTASFAPMVTITIWGPSSEIRLMLSGSNGVWSPRVLGAPSALSWRRSVLGRELLLEHDPAGIVTQQTGVRHNRPHFGRALIQRPRSHHVHRLYSGEHQNIGGGPGEADLELLARDG